MRVRKKKLLSLRTTMIIFVAEYPRSSSRSSVKDPSGYGVLLAIAVMVAAVATLAGGREEGRAAAAAARGGCACRKH